LIPARCKDRATLQSPASETFAPDVKVVKVFFLLSLTGGTNKQEGEVFEGGLKFGGNAWLGISLLPCKY